MKNRKRESCTSGSVRDEGGNILIYSEARERGGVAGGGAGAAAGDAGGRMIGRTCEHLLQVCTRAVDF